MQASLYHSFTHHPHPRILIVENDKEAQEAHHLARYCIEQGILQATPLVLPDFRARKGDDIRSFLQEFIHLLSVLGEFYARPDSLLIAPLSSVLYPLPKPELLQGIRISKQDLIDLESLKLTLVHFGYEVVDIIEMEGEVSFRGDVIDVSIPDGGAYRLSFFDVECESIRLFDIKTQKSNPQELDELFITPALFSLDAAQYEELKERVEESEFDTFSRDITSLGFWHLEEMAIRLLEHYPSLMTKSAQDYAKEIFEFDLQAAYGLEYLLALPALEEVKGYVDVSVDEKNLDYFLELHREKKITLLVPTELMACLLYTSDAADELQAV